RVLFRSRDARSGDERRAAAAPSAGRGPGSASRIAPHGERRAVRGDHHPVHHQLRRESAPRGGHGGRGRERRVHPPDRPVRHPVQPSLPGPVRAVAARGPLALPTGPGARPRAPCGCVAARTFCGGSELTHEHEIAVIGAGPCGLGVGVAASQAGVGCVLFDRGCITHSIAGFPTDMTFFSTADRLELGGVPFVSTAPRPTRREALAYYRAIVRYFRLDVRQYEEVIAVEGRAGAFRLRTRRLGGGEAEHRAAYVVFATGYFDSPNLLGVPGEDLPKVTHYYREAHPYYDQDCLVVGGGNSAVEAALDLYRTGARVTLVHFANGLDRGVKPWIVPDITNRLQNGEIAVYWRT